MNRRAQTHERDLLLSQKVWVDDAVDDHAPDALGEHCVAPVTISALYPLNQRSCSLRKNTFPRNVPYEIP